MIRCNSLFRIYTNLVPGERYHLLVGFEALTTVVTKSSTFWDITPCNRLEINLRFGEKYRFQLQGLGIRGFLLPTSRWFLAWFILRHWRWRYISPNRLIFNRLHALNSRKQNSSCLLLYQINNLYLLKPEISTDFRLNFRIFLVSPGMSKC
jgi:hypothetical protein